MTFRQWAEDYCYNRGMFPDQAKAVVDSLVIQKHEAMKD